MRILKMLCFIFCTKLSHIFISFIQQIKNEALNLKEKPKKTSLKFGFGPKMHVNHDQLIGPGAVSDRRQAMNFPIGFYNTYQTVLHDPPYNRWIRNQSPQQRYALTYEEV